MDLLSMVKAAVNNAPWDWLWATLASLGFVAIVAGSAELMNHRDRLRRRREAALSPRVAETSGPRGEPVP